MTVRCGWTHDASVSDEARSEHARGCARCAEELALRARAREAWRAMKARDDDGASTARERRIRARARDMRGTRSSIGATAIALAAFVVLFAATATAMVLRARRAPAEGPAEIALVHRPYVEDRTPLAAPKSNPEAPAPEVSPAPVLEETPTPQTARHASSPVAGADGAALWGASEDALLRGDRPAAEASLRALLGGAPGPELAARAGLRLSELLLARGAVAEARARLEPLASDARAETAGDAVWMYARSFPDPRDQAAAWGRFLAKHPTGSMHDLALVQRAAALRAAEGASIPARDEAEHTQ